MPARTRSSTAASRAEAAIQRRGILLVYPVANAAEPRALWHELFPGVPMRWAWDDSADERVVALWHLRETLSRSDAVVYTKWLGGRATFFSRELFAATLAGLRAAAADGPNGLVLDLAAPARAALEVLEDDSPKATRALRAALGLEGRLHDAAFGRALRPLFQRLAIVGRGEVAEGGFPSLAVGATSLVLEDLWAASARDDAAHAARREAACAASRPYARTYARVLRGLASRVPPSPRSG